MRTFAADKVLFDMYRWVGAHYILIKVTKSRHTWHQYIATAICVRSTLYYLSGSIKATADLRWIKSYMCLSRVNVELTQMAVAILWMVTTTTLSVLLCSIKINAYQSAAHIFIKLYPLQRYALFSNPPNFRRKFNSI